MPNPPLNSLSLPLPLHPLRQSLSLHPPLPPSSGLKIEVPQWSGKWVVSMDEYRNGVVGAKSKNLAGLRGKLPAHIKLPASVTLPFGCFEKVGD